MHLRSLSLLALLLPCASGCGVFTHREDPAATDWPVLSGAGARPTALVRTSLEGRPIGDERHLVDDSGLFSRVAHQTGQGETFASESDYVLDLALRREGDAGWYTAAGVITLGALPIVWEDDIVLTCEVRDRDHRTLALLEERVDKTQVMWIPLLPITVVASLIPDEPARSGFDVIRDGEADRLVVKDAMKRLLARAQQECGFESGG